MTEIFDVILAVNRLRDRVDYLCLRIDFLCKYPSTLTNDKYVSPEAASRILHVSMRCLRRYRQENKIPFVRLKRRILYSRDDLEKYLNS